MIVLMILIFLFIIFKLQKNKSFSMIFGILFLIEMIWMMISCAYLDYNRTYISETAVTSYHTGALFRLIILYIPFILVICSKNSGKIKKEYNVKFTVVNINKRTLLYGLQMLAFVVVAYSFLDMLISGIPLFSDEITRINFTRYSTLPLATLVNGEVTFFLILICGIIFFEKDRKFDLFKFISLVILFISCFHRLLMEYKYHGMYNIIFMFFLPKIIQIIKDRNFKIVSTAFLIKCGVVVFAFLGVCLLIYSMTNLSAFMFDRIFALQAHTFWGIDKYYYIDCKKELFGSSEALYYEFKNVFERLGSLDKNSGVARVMYMVCSAESIDLVLASGTRFACSYLTIGINTIGYIGTFFLSFFIGSLCVFIFKVFYSALKNNEFMMLYLSQSVFWDLLDYFRVGNFAALLNIKTLLFLSIIVLVFFAKKNYIRKHSIGEFNEEKRISADIATYNDQKMI